MNTTTVQTDEDLNDWWAILAISKDKTIAPIVFDRDHNPRIRAYRRDHWDTRFAPLTTADSVGMVQNNIGTWASSARRRRGSVLIAIPAAGAAAAWGYPVAKCSTGS